MVLFIFLFSNLNFFFLTWKGDITRHIQQDIEKLERQEEIKKRLINAYGTRIPDNYRISIKKESDRRINEFYSKIHDNEIELLNKKLQNQYQIQKNKVIDFNFDQVNREYIQQYGRFLREQQNYDGLRKHNASLVSVLKRLKHLMLHIPELETPRIYKIDKNVEKLQKMRSGILMSNRSGASQVQDFSKISQFMKGDENEAMQILKEYNRKMELMKNRLAKYDVEGSNDGILGEVGRFLEHGHRIILEDSAEEDSETKKMNEVDRLMQGRQKERMRNDMGHHKSGGWLKMNIN